MNCPLNFIHPPCRACCFSKLETGKNLWLCDFPYIGNKDLRELKREYERERAK